MNLREALRLNPEAEVSRIAAQTVVWLREMKRRGAVIGLSGGVDSSVTAALSVRALGPDRVFGIFMPELDSSPDSLRLGLALANVLRIRTKTEEISGILREAGCYTRRDDAIRSVVPGYASGWKSKIVLPNSLDGAAYQLFSLVVQSPDGVLRKERLSLDAYLAIVAASNFKQRTRKMIEYYHADRLNYAVAGTPNWLEYDQGFFVKNGDGAADFKPIAHLYKSQVYQLAEYLDIPEEIRRRPPTTDTYSLEQSQEEFYFALPYEEMDMAAYALDQGVPAEEAADQLGLTPQQTANVYQIIVGKRKAAHYLKLAPATLPPYA